MKPRTCSLSRALALSIALAAPSMGALSPADASASVSIAATFDDLLRASTTAVVVSTLDSRAVWEDGRIYTYTHVRVERPIAGELGTDAEAWVRTMGGVVGKVGQIVEGEAVFTPGDRSVLFLRPGPVGAYVVTDRGQGQFPVVTDDHQTAHVVRSRAMGMLLPPRRVLSTGTTPRLAADVLHDRPVDDAVREIAAAWVAAHAP